MSSITLARVGNGATLALYATVPTWDAVGYVTSVATALPTTTTTDYLAGGFAEQVVGGTLTSYYGVPGAVTAVSMGGTTLSYLASDGLGSVTAALSSSSALLSASQLFGPYGATRYQSGVMPTAKGFTGQYADAATGLDYYNARYYDPLAGQFISADSVLPGDGLDVWGLSRFAYVAGNPETGTDPSGHRVCQSASCDRGGGSRHPSSGDQDVSYLVTTTEFGWGGFQGLAVHYAKLALKAKEWYNTPRVPVSRYMRANGTVVEPHLRRGWGAIASAEDAGELAGSFRLIGRTLFWVGVITDGLVSGMSYYNSHANDPQRGEKAVIAGVMHTALSTAFAVSFAAAAGALPVVGESGVAELAAGMLGASIGGNLADSIVNDTPAVAVVANAVDTVGNAASSVGSAIGSLGTSLSGLFG